MAKIGFEGATRLAAFELAPDIRVNVVHPAWSCRAPADRRRFQVRQGIMPLGAGLGADDVADAVLYLAGARHVTGEVIFVDSGQRLIGTGNSRLGNARDPGWADAAARRQPEVDLLVVGAGAGGMTAALVAATLGLDVLLVEKAATVGGTTALSAGSVWVPGSHHAPPRTMRDNALRYLRAAIGNRLRAPLADAFLAAGREMVRFLEQHSAVAFRAYRLSSRLSRRPAGCDLVGARAGAPAVRCPGAGRATSRGCGRPCRNSPCSAA